MKRPPIRVLDVVGSPAAMGYAHGRAHAEEIRTYAQDRLNLLSSTLWGGRSRSDVLDLARACLPAHEAHSAALYTEMVGIAEGAGITPAEIVLVGGFTDFLDIVRNSSGDVPLAAATEDHCTAFIVPDHRAAGAGFLGQTWDMHDSATDYVLLLRLAPENGPAALVFTTTGCVGQFGINELGVCVGINNLTAADGRIGVTWPFVVRHALMQPTATDARDVILEANLAGGHNFLLFDRSGVGYNVEAMPTQRPVTQLNADPLVHTNHTLTPAATAGQGRRPTCLQDSSMSRLRKAIDLLDHHDIMPQDLMALTREPSAICQVARDPYRFESSGAAIMRPRTSDVWAVWGLPSMNEFYRIPILA